MTITAGLKQGDRNCTLVYEIINNLYIKELTINCEYISINKLICWVRKTGVHPSVHNMDSRNNLIKFNLNSIGCDDKG